MYQSLKILGVFGALLLSISVSADTEKSLAQQAAERAKEYSAVESAVPTDEDKKRAEAASDLALERGRQALREWQAQQPRGASAGVAPTLSDKKSAASGKDEEPGPTSSGKLIVALSSSMPLTMVHDYMQQLAGIPEAAVVLRGFIGGAHTVAPTGKWIEEVRRVVPDCLRCKHYNVQVLVDPLIYRDLEITQVPAVAYAPGVTDISHCDGKSLKGIQIAFGATSVEAAVKALVATGTDIPNTLVTKVKRKGWETRNHKQPG